MNTSTPLIIAIIASERNKDNKKSPHLLLPPFSSLIIISYLL